MLLRRSGCSLERTGRPLVTAHLSPRRSDRALPVAPAPHSRCIASSPRERSLMGGSCGPSTTAPHEGRVEEGFTLSHRRWSARTPHDDAFGWICLDTSSRRPVGPRGGRSGLRGGPSGCSLSGRTDRRRQGHGCSPVGLLADRTIGPTAGSGSVGRAVSPVGQAAEWTIGPLVRCARWASAGPPRWESLPPDRFTASQGRRWPLASRCQRARSGSPPPSARWGAGIADRATGRWSSPPRGQPGHPGRSDARPTPPRRTSGDRPGWRARLRR